MAENAVGFFLGKLSELLSTKLDQVRGVDIKIRSLRNKLEMMHAFLKDIDGRRRDNERIKVWVDQVRDTTFRAEDAIDRFICEVQCRRHAGFVGSMKNFASFAGRLKVRYELASEIEDIVKILQDITDSASKFGIDLQQSQGETSSTNSNLQRQQSRPLAADLKETKVIGFDHHIATLVNQLKQGDVVVPIVGMGGLGKTTLARSICNHADINRHFECQVWVSVSQKYRERDLLKSMLEDLLKPTKEKLNIPGKKEDETEQFNRDELEKMTEIDMENKLKGHLQGKRHLLVIDDIWDTEAWNCIHRALPNENNGSGIILTTRNEDVAKCVHPSATPYNIETLDGADGWKLLRSKVFKTDEGISEGLEELGMKMVSKCGGLPLAITVLGGFLSRKPKSDIEWREVLKRITHELHERDDGQNVRRILALSYDDLPHYLRSCFLYLGLFPKNSEIDVKNLTQLWVAEGFIQGRGEQTMEEVAQAYVGELVDRCMIQVVKRNSWGGVDSCHVHDFLLDLSITQGKEDKFLGILAGNPPANNAQQAASPRRAAVHGQSISECMPTHRSSPSSLRSLLCFNAEVNLSQVRLVVNNLKLLRVLDLKGANILRLPKQIGGMVHLRYLGLEVELGEVGILKLPSSVGKLRNLQTLRVGVCLVPDSVRKIVTLRHITGDFVVFQRGTLHSNCKGDLQTLWGINAGSWVGKALGDFTNLRTLQIHNILATHVTGLSESLKKLTRLNKLSLHSVGAPTMVETVLAALENHPVLYELTFIGEKAEKTLCLPWARIIGLIGTCSTYPHTTCTRFPCIMSSYAVARLSQEWQPPQLHCNHRFPPSLTRLEVGITNLFSKGEGFASLESLPNLKVLKLCENACIRKEMIFNPRSFTKLQELQLCELEELEQLTIHDAALPCLKRLMINKCPMLESLPEGLQQITTLQQLELKSMRPEFTRKIQKEEGEDWNKVQHIPYITIE